MSEPLMTHPDDKPVWDYVKPEDGSEAWLRERSKYSLVRPKAIIIRIRELQERVKELDVRAHAEHAEATRLRERVKELEAQRDKLRAALEGLVEECSARATVTKVPIAVKPPMVVVERARAVLAETADAEKKP